MSAPPYQPSTPAPSAHPDPDPTRHLNAPPYPPPDQQPGRHPLQFNAADRQGAQQTTVSQTDVYETQGPVLLGGNQPSSAIPNQLQSTYDSSSQGYHAQGQVTNSLNIDPALLALGQGARQQPAVPQLNFHAGAQVTFAAPAIQQSFAGNAFQQSLITQGNQNMRVEGTEPSANDADQMNEGAPMFEAPNHDFNDNNSFLSKYDLDTMTPAYGLESFHKKPDDSHGLMLPPPLPFKALARNIGNNDYQVFAQQGGVHPTGFSDVFNADPMNSGDNHTVGGASAMQESIRDSRWSASSAKKRGRSSSDDGSSKVSTEGFHKPKRATTKRKRARTSQSTTSVSSSESQVPLSLSRRASLLAADDSDFKVASGPLQGMSRERAAEMCIKRVDLDFTGADNVDEVKAEREKWIHDIMQSFDDPYNPAPKTKNIDLEGFKQWQKEHHALTTEQFREDPTNMLAEAIATHLYNQVVDSHEKGSLVKSSGTSFIHDCNLKCKDRLEDIIKVLTGLTIIRYDLVTGARVHELVANPDAVFKRKEDNKQENDRKRVKKEAEDATKATDKKKTSAKKAKNGKTETNNKHSGQSTSAIVEESSSGSNDHSDPEAVRPSTLVANYITQPKPVNSVNDDESSSGPGDEGLAAEPEAMASSARVSTSATEPQPAKPVYDEESDSGPDL
jgi:endonuclease V-like protein UPF0215 family